jgi:hypothetical protein
VIFIIDESGSISDSDFKILKNFMVDLVGLGFSINNSRTNLGAFGFSNDVSPPYVTLGEFHDTANIVPRINGIKQMGGGTNTYLGLQNSIDMFKTYGRPPTSGASRLVLLLTDGESTNTGLTVAAAEAVLKAGITILVMTIDFDTSKPNSQKELKAQTRGDDSLWFDVKDWSGLENDDYIISGIGAAACNAPIAPSDPGSNITTPLACNQTVFITYEVQTSTPLGVVVTSSVPADVCYSYSNRRPRPTDPVSAPGQPAAVTCVRVPPNDANITISTYPSVSAPGSAQDPSLDLFVSVTAANATAAAAAAAPGGCDGTTNVTALYCALRWAPGVVPVPGSGADAPPPVVSELGSPGAPRCGGCPPGGAYLGGAFADVCGPYCRGGAQYVSRATATCLDCDAACAACDPYAAAGAPPARACTSCATGAGWLAARFDPAQTSPFWARASQRLPAAVRPAAAAALPAAAGRCVAGGCPAGFSVAGGAAPARPGVPQAVPCQATPQAAAAAWSSVLITLCVPRAAGVAPPAPGTNSTLAKCRDFADDARAPALALQLSIALGVPPPALYLRSCLDVGLLKRYVWTYQLQAATDAAEFDEPDAAAAVANATRRAGSDCACDAFVTFGLVLGVAEPGSLVTPDDRFAALTSLSSDAATLARRAALAVNLTYNGTINATGLPLDPTAPLGDPSGGYPPLRCDGVRALLLGACSDAVTATTLVGPDYIASTNVITFCGGRPPPEVFPVVPFPVAAVAGGVGGGVLFLILMGLVLLLWSRAVTKRLKVLADHKARVARSKRRGNREAAVAFLNEDHLAAPGDGRQIERAAFGPVAAESASAQAVDATYDTEAYAGGSASGVASWANDRLRAELEAAKAEESNAARSAASTTVEVKNPSFMLAAARTSSQTMSAEKQSRIMPPRGDEEWQAVPYSSLSTLQRVQEWIMPGALTVGMGLRGDSVPVSHDLAHPMGPKEPAAYLANKKVVVHMGDAGGIPTAWGVSGTDREQISARVLHAEAAFACAGASASANPLAKEPTI